MITRENYFSDAEWQHFLDFSKDFETPFIVVNLRRIRESYLRLRESFPFAKVYYAVKANPDKAVITLLSELGSCFDIASRYELDLVLSLGVSPDRLSYGNTIKKAKDVAYFYEKGVRLFVTDSKEDLKNIAACAPGSRIFARLLMENTGDADWPLSRKFGCHPDMAYELLVEAKSLRLDPYGVSFHVGSQQKDIGQWKDALAKTKQLFSSLKEEKGITLSLINLGGGFPATYIHPTNDLSLYASEINQYLADNFGSDIPEIILEPGRSLVGNSGILTTEVVLISKKNNAALNRWVYLDAGLFNGLFETLNESIKFPIVTSSDDPNGKKAEVILAGPTCDSTDILYEDYKYSLPVDLKIGDKVYFLTTGAYTASYASVCFNGFPPIKAYFMDF